MSNEVEKLEFNANWKERVKWAFGNMSRCPTNSEKKTVSTSWLYSRNEYYLFAGFQQCFLSFRKTLQFKLYARLDRAFSLKTIWALWDICMYVCMEKLGLGIKQLYPDCTEDPAGHISTWGDTAWTRSRRGNRSEQLRSRSYVRRLRTWCPSIPKWPKRMEIVVIQSDSDSV